MAYTAYKNGFLKRFKPDMHLLTSAALADPGNKSLSWLPVQKREAAVALFLEEVCCLAGLEDGKDDIVPDPVEVPDDVEVPAIAAPALAQRDDAPVPPDALDDFFDLNDEATSSFARISFLTIASQKEVPLNPDAPRHTLRSIITEEVKKYFEERVGENMWRQRDFSLTWWGDNEGRYPHVAQIALKYLAIPASSAPSERIFSQVKAIIDRKRWALDSLIGWRKYV